MELALIIKFILIAMIIFSAISYLFRRSSNKKNSQEAIQYYQHIRKLSGEELQLLKPYLDDKNKVKPYKYQSSLKSQDVVVISGVCVRHSLTSNSAESSCYFVISGIKVFFPYGMDCYTILDNIAEVVFTKNYAFVVNLNGYDMARAKAERETEALRNEHWSLGSRGQFKTVSEEDISRIEKDELDNKINELIVQTKNRHCEILEQRDETPLEVKRRNRFNSGFITVIALVLFVVMTLIYETIDDLWTIIISGISLIIAIVFYFYQPKLSVRKINRVRGTVEVKDTTTKTILIGESLTLYYPKHWQDVLPEKTYSDIDIDVTVVEKELIRYGNSLSISKEIEQYGPPRFWGQNCIIFITGVILSWIIYLFSNSLTDDGIFTYRLFTNNISILTITDYDALKNLSIEQGDWVNINLSGASCDVIKSYRCQKIFITNDKIDVSKMITSLPDWAEKSSNDSLVITTPYLASETLDLYGSLFSSDNNNYNWSNQKKYTRLINIEKLALVTEEACMLDHNICARLKEIFTILLTDDTDNNFASWSEVLAYAKKQQNISAIVYTSTANEISRLFTSLSTKQLMQQQEVLIGELKRNQQRPTSIEINLANNDDTKVSVINNNINYRGLEYYFAIAAGLGQIELNGLVSDVNYHSDGSMANMTINSDYRYQMTDIEVIPAACITFISFTIIVMLTVIQLFIILNKIRINKRRLCQIKVDYRNLIL